jgi:hypothetical protein
MKIEKNNYLTETKLGEFLKILYPDKEFVRDKCVPNSNCIYRPDYRNDELKLIVEFDGSSHYTSSKRIFADIEKDKIFKYMGYKIIRIPYFIQLSPAIIRYLFGKSPENLKQIYPHGFIDYKCTLPSDFCELGLEKFKKDLDFFSFIKNEILKSLKNKIKENKGEMLKVLPPSWNKIIKKPIIYEFKDSEYKKFYKEYKKLGGKKEAEEYEFYLKIFISITEGSFTGGPCYFESKQDSLNKFKYIVSSEKEVGLFFNSVNNMHCYS